MTYSLRRTQVLTGTAVLTAIVIILQLAVSIPIGPFTITLTLVPVILGAVMYGPACGALLGTVFGLTVCYQVVTGAAGALSSQMLTYQPVLTIAVCIVKGMAAGLVSGLIVKALRKKNLWAGVLVGAMAAPVCNTGIFIAAFVTIFSPIAREWAASVQGADGQSLSVMMFVLTMIIGINFLVEFAVNVLMVPVVLRVVKAVSGTGY